jgi:hypothetical protein
VPAPLCARSLKKARFLTQLTCFNSTRIWGKLCDFAQTLDRFNTGLACDKRFIAGESQSHPTDPSHRLRLET